MPDKLFVIYQFPNNGSDCDRALCQDLVLGETYEVTRVDVGGWDTRIYLEGFGDIRFNVVNFSTDGTSVGIGDQFLRDVYYTLGGRWDRK